MSRQKANIDLDKLEELAALGMSKREIASFLGIGESTLYDHQASDPAISERYQRGRAKGLADVLAVIKNAATKDKDVRAALEYAKRLADCWREPAKVEQESGEQGQTAGAALSDEQKVRAAIAFLKTKGQLPAGTKPLD